MARQVSTRTRRLLDALGWASTETEARQANRRMERWIADGLGPLVRFDDPTDESPHWQAVAEIAGKGTVADTTAVRLARRGFTCRRLGHVLRRTWQLDRMEAQADLDPYGVDQDVVFDLGAALADELDKANPGPLDLALRAALSPVRRNAGVDGNHLNAAVADIAALTFGGLPIEEAIPMNGEPWPHSSPDVSPWLLRPGAFPGRQVAVVVKHYLSEVVAAVPVTTELLRALESGLNDDELGDLAVLLAPMEVLDIRRRRAALLMWAKTGGAWKVDYQASTRSSP